MAFIQIDGFIAQLNVSVLEHYQSFIACYKLFVFTLRHFLILMTM